MRLTPEPMHRADRFDRRSRRTVIPTRLAALYDGTDKAQVQNVGARFTQVEIVIRSRYRLCTAEAGGLEGPPASRLSLGGPAYCSGDSQSRDGSLLQSL
jgi:hypothetical protein